MNTNDSLTECRVVFFYGEHVLELERKVSLLQDVVGNRLTTCCWNEVDFRGQLSLFDVAVLDWESLLCVTITTIIRCFNPRVKIIVGTCSPCWNDGVDCSLAGAFYGFIWQVGSFKNSLRHVLTHSMVKLEWSVEGLDLSKRAYNAIRRFLNFRYPNGQLIPLWEITNRIEPEILAIPGFGYGCLIGLKEKLTSRGLNLRAF